MDSSAINYWPFAYPGEDLSNSLGTDGLAFVLRALELGFSPFRFGADNLGARLDEKHGNIIRRGNSRWEIALDLANENVGFAYVSDYSAASIAIFDWLLGEEPSVIFKKLEHVLIKRHGNRPSCGIYNST
jgi:hypothetical protein